MSKLTKNQKSLVFFCFLAIIVVFAVGDYLYYFNRLYPGLYYKGYDLGGMTLNEVEQELAKIEMTFIDSEGQELSLPLATLGIKIDGKELFDTAYWLGRPTPWPGNYLHRLKNREQAIHTPVSFSTEPSQLAKSVDHICNIFSREAENSFFKATGETFYLASEQYGYIYNREDLKNLILANLSQESYPLQITVPYSVKLDPLITKASLLEKGIEEHMVTFSTKFDPEVLNRVHNLKLAAAELNNLMLGPEQVFSLNKVLGDTVAAKGYKMAPVIVGGKLSEGVGGGICQVSSTLYNAALLTDLEILERHNHHLTVLYVDPGRDATISYPSLDLKFRNNKDHYILLSTELVGDTLTFSLFGKAVETDVQIVTKVLDTYDPPIKYQYDAQLSPGEEKVTEGYAGYLVEVWKQVYRNGQLKSEVQISKDRYLPHPQIIRRGPQ